MPRYYFHFRYARRYSRDDEGVDFDSVEEAYLQAFSAAREMWPDLLRQRRDPAECAFEIADLTGTTLFVLPFLEILEACQTMAEPLPQPPGSIFHQALSTAERANRLCVEFTRGLESVRASLRQARALIAAVGEAAD